MTKPAGNPGGDWCDDKVLRRNLSEHVRRDEYRGAGHRAADQERDDRKAHDLADIQLRDREQGQQPKRLNHIRDPLADRDCHGDQPEVCRRMLVQGKRLSQRRLVPARPSGRRRTARTTR